MSTKILRLSHITNGGPGSGESEGHEFRGNQWDSMPTPDGGSRGYVGTEEYKNYIGSKGVSKEAFDKVETALFQHAGNASEQKYGDLALVEARDIGGEELKMLQASANLEEYAAKSVEDYDRLEVQKQIEKLDRISPDKVDRTGKDEFDADMLVGSSPKHDPEDYDRDWKESRLRLEEKLKEPLVIYRKSSSTDSTKQILSFTQNKEGAVTNPITGGDQIITPDMKWTLDDVKSNGYRIISGFARQRGRSGEAEVLLMKVSPRKTNIINIGIDDSISSIVKQYLESNVDSTLSTVSSSHIIGALTAKGNLQENPMVSFDLLRQQSLDYAMEHTKEIIEKGGSTIQGKFKPWLSDADNELRSSISTVITDGINKGKSRDEIKRDLKAVYDADDVRIDRIAGWEIPDAQYQGAFQQYDEDGVTIFEWLLGDSPCEVCEPYGEKRFFTADELPDNLLHPGCQCDIAPVVSDQLTSMIRRMVNGGEGSGEHEGHEFRGNQYSGLSTQTKHMLYSDSAAKSHSKSVEGQISPTKEYGKKFNKSSELYGHSDNDIGYCNFGFMSTNNYLRGLDDSNTPKSEKLDKERIENITKFIDGAVDSSPSIPSGVELWRGVDMETGISLRSSNIGDVIEDKAFMSTSINPLIASRFSYGYQNGKNVEATIVRVVSDGNVKGLMTNTPEKEIILKRGMKLEIVGKETTAGRVDWVGKPTSYQVMRPSEMTKAKMTVITVRPVS